MTTPAISLTAAELQAIEAHKYFLSEKRGVEVTIEEAIADFIENVAADWRQEKLRRDNLDQREEIERHKYLRSQEEGRDIGRQSAAEEWCQKYAHIWRAERESLEQNGFQKMQVTVRNPEGLHLRPVSAITALVCGWLDGAVGVGGSSRVMLGGVGRGGRRPRGASGGCVPGWSADRKVPGKTGGAAGGAGAITGLRSA